MKIINSNVINSGFFRVGVSWSESELLKKKRLISKSVYISLEEFLDFDLFKKKLSFIKLGERYIFLVRVYYEEDLGGSGIGQENVGGIIKWKTLDEQIILKDLNIFNYNMEIEKLQKTIFERLTFSMEKYKFEYVNLIGLQLVVYYTNFDTISKLKRKLNLSSKSFGEQKDLVNVSMLKSSLNKIYPINERDNFGVLLVKKILGDKIEYIVLLDGSKVDFQKCVNNYSNKYVFTINMDFYQKKVDNEYYIFVVNLVDKLKKSVFIFNISGMKINHIIDESYDDNIIRQQGNIRFYINKFGEIYKKEISTKFSPIYVSKLSGRLSRLNYPDHKFGSLDLETYTFQQKSYVYALGFYIENDLKTFYIDKDLSSDELLLKCFNCLLTDKYNGYTFYVHNLSEFDIYFILPTLNRINQVYPNKFEFKNGLVFRDAKIISMKISTKVQTEKSSKVYSIKLVDSLKLLNSSLDNLCKTFNTNVQKSYFPYNFVKKDTLFYVGDKPSIEYYEHIDKNVYNSINKYDWSTEKETMYYLKNDLISLYEVMKKFITSEYINYHVHVTSSLTISSLSMDIFLRRFYKNNIPLIKDKSIFNDIKSSYFGGITEVYKPYGKNLFYYDVNSLYPHSALNTMPGLSCVYIDNINQNINDINNLFGFYYCDIECYKGYLGLLSVRTDGTITQPLGKFRG